MKLIPANRPKSVVIYLASFLISFLSVPLAFFFNPSISIIFFGACWLVGFVAVAIYVYGLLTGKYSRMEARAWKEQVW